MLHMAWSRNARDDKIQVAPRSPCHVRRQLEVPTIALPFPQSFRLLAEARTQLRACLETRGPTILQSTISRYFWRILWRVWDILVWHQKCLQRVQMNAPLTKEIQLLKPVHTPSLDILGSLKSPLCVVPWWPQRQEQGSTWCLTNWHWKIQWKKEILKSTYGVSVYSITL